MNSSFVKAVFNFSTQKCQMHTQAYIHNISGGGHHCNIVENKKRGQLRSAEIRSELPLEHRAVILCPPMREGGWPSAPCCHVVGGVLLHPSGKHSPLSLRSFKKAWILTASHVLLVPGFLPEPQHPSSSRSRKAGWEMGCLLGEGPLDQPLLVSPAAPTK